MRTTLNIDDETMEVVMEETKGRSRSEAVRQALAEYVRRKQAERIIALKGKVKFDLDWKSLRKGWRRNSRGPR